MGFNDEDAKVARKFTSLMNSANKRKKEFSLTLQDVRKLLRRKKCAYTGVSLTEAVTAVQGTPVTPQATDRTMDRIDNSIGYHPHNVVAVCHLANQMKEALLESKFNGTGIHHLSCEWTFLRSFVKGLDKVGYRE
jgi:hypothetical protein